MQISDSLASDLSPKTKTARLDNDVSSSGFMKLPPEVREDIYKYAWEMRQKHAVHFRYNTGEDYNLPCWQALTLRHETAPDHGLWSLSMCNKTIRSETSRYVQKGLRFHVDLNSFLLPNANWAFSRPKMEHCVRKYNLNSATSLSISVRVDLTAFGALEHLLRGIDWGQNLTSLEFYFEGCCCRSMETKTLADSIWPEIKTKALIEVHCSTKWCPKKGGWFEEAEASRLELLGLEHLIGPPEEAAASEDNGTTESQDSIANEVQMVERGQ